MMLLRRSLMIDPAPRFWGRSEINGPACQTSLEPKKLPQQKHYREFVLVWCHQTFSEVKVSYHAPYSVWLLLSALQPVFFGAFIAYEICSKLNFYLINYALMVISVIFRIGLRWISVVIIHLTNTNCLR